jgi:hypothetical protein
VEAGCNKSTVALRVVGGDKRGSLESETAKCGSESPASIVNDRPILSSKRMLYKDYDRMCSIEKNIQAVGLKVLGANTN